MKKILFIFIISLFSCFDGYTQVTGQWKVVDDKDGIEKSIVEIFEKNNKYYGRIVQLLETSKRTHCDQCPGELRGKPLTGMVIIFDLEKTSKGGKNGKVLDPGSGSIFSCAIELESQDKLKLRGYLGTPAVGKTSYWNRLK
jgi:uncharacterized protein (DUF2147 family)